MTDDRRSGIALMVGSAGALMTMAIHPTASGAATAADYEHLARVSAIAHSTGIVSFAMAFLGACGLSARLREPARIALAGLVAFGLATIAALIAAAISGFIEPAIMLRMVRDAPAAASQWHIVLDAVFQINQAFARIFAVGASGAVLLWSIAALRSRALGPRLATCGWMIAVATIGGVLAGHIRMNVHGMAVIVVAQAIWFWGAGLQLCQSKAIDPSTP